MFLSQLNRKEKEIFWNLANIVMRSDNEATQAELDMLETYEEEMQEDFTDCELNHDFTALLEELQGASTRIKKIIYFELYGLVYADGKYQSEERDLMAEMQQAFALTDADAKALGQAVIDIMNIYTKLGEIIN